MTDHELRDLVETLAVRHAELADAQRETVRQMKETDLRLRKSKEYTDRSLRESKVERDRAFKETDRSRRLPPG